ncbi:MAG TPA: cation-translocating P-type ATPase [Thermomicrobiales bacterium]|nr:cation-translocating P-type ATPase [Thermomicrobiales bacterium]
MHTTHLSTVREQFANPLSRRQWLTAISGLLITVGLVLKYTVDAQAAWTWLMVAAALVAGSDIAVRAINALRVRQISIELLVTIAATGALIIGEVWEAAAVTFLFMLGAYLEARTLSKTRAALQDLIELAPEAALVERDGVVVEEPIGNVRPGDVVVVKPGSRIPVDGLVIDGSAAVDESAITGEPMPENKATDAGVYAGTIALNGLLRVRATGVGGDTMLGRIIERVEEAQEAKAPAQRFIERFARWYTPAIIGLSIVAWLVSRDIRLALTLLVIGCPGALVISTPVSVMAGIGRAARRGILIKGGEHLEQAGKITAVAFDKTGTLTEGRPSLTEVIALQPLAAHADNHAPALGGHWATDQTEVLRWAAIAESGSEHPLARPIMAAAPEVPALDPDAFTVHPGRGVSVTHDGHLVSVGNTELMRELDIPVGRRVADKLTRLRQAGRTAVLVGLDNRAIGILGIADAVRPEAAETVARLRANGIKRVLMLTGDDRQTAMAVAEQVGITEVHAELMPDDKLALIRQLQDEGYVVAMAGDGINDAPALVAADAGVAMGTAGADVAIETAAIALVGDDLGKLPEAIALSRATVRNIRQNVVIALLTVGALLAGVLFGEVQMAGGMFVHQVSVLVVIANGMRLLRTKPALRTAPDATPPRPAQVGSSETALA